MHTLFFIDSHVFDLVNNAVYLIEAILLINLKEFQVFILPFNSVSKCLSELSIFIG